MAIPFLLSLEPKPAATEGSDFVYLGPGDVVFDALGGNDTLYGGTGNDTLEGGAGIDTLYGEAGNDYINGYIGNETYYGGAGSDSLLGNSGNDSLYGGAGIDTLEGGAGSDSFYFDAQDTGDYFASPSQADTIQDFNNDDNIYLNGVSSFTISTLAVGWLVTWQDASFNYHDIYVLGDDPTGDVFA